MILRADPIGNPDFLRYVINDIENKEFWNGKKFIPDVKESLRYACLNQTCKDMGEILRNFYSPMKKRTFVVPIEIDVFGMANPKEVTQYLYRASEFKIRTDVYGNGPPGNLVLPVIRWARIEESGGSDQLLDFDDM